MAEHSTRSRPGAGTNPAWREIASKRWVRYAGAALLVLLVLAWIDGGVEPLHPIEQPVRQAGDPALHHTGTSRERAAVAARTAVQAFFDASRR